MNCWTNNGTAGSYRKARSTAGTKWRANPLAPDECLKGITTARYTDGDYASALEMLERIVDPDNQSEALRAACLAQLGRDSEARSAAARAVEMGGDFLQSQEWLTSWPFKYPADREHFLDGLRKSEVLRN